VEKKAIITGITGQDGAYLAKHLIEKGYLVIGLTRSYTSTNLKGLEYLNIVDSVLIEECDLLDISQIFSILKKHKPTEIYNLSAQSSVSNSFKQPIGTVNYNIISVLNLLEGIMFIDRNIRLYQASSSEMYGKVDKLPISESTVLHPLSPYAISKASAHWLCINYRESYGLFVSCGILFNHESYLRSERFFIKKVIREAIKIKFGEQELLKVGNLNIRRDFGYAPKYAEAMYLMMQHTVASDFIICSGVSISLLDVVNYIFDYLKIEKAKIVVDKDLFRPTEIEDIYGDNSKAKSLLGWDYDYRFQDILNILLEEELQNFQGAENEVL
jgi:GDPmannose 4,6-dehydratase